MRVIPTGRALLLIVPLALLGEVDASAQEVGSIEGEVSLNIRPPRHSASRYPGGSPAAHAIQEISAVAFLKGSVAGAPTRPGPMLMMTQTNNAFVPSILVVPVGSRVSFPNGDPFFHNVFSYSSAKRFDLGRFPKGQSKQVLFNEAGIVNVYCEVHVFMRSAVVVVENPLHAIVTEDGTFAIDDVPPGDYTLVVWHVDMGVAEQSVTVSASGTVRVSVELK